MINFTAIKDIFWDAHPDLAIIEPFKSLFKNDKSASKKQSSDMMWFVVLCYDRNSKFYRLEGEGEDGKHVLIGEDFLNDIEYYHKHQEALDDLISKYITIQMTPTQRMLHNAEKILDRRRRVMDELSLSKKASDWKEVDKMLQGTKKVTDDIAAIREKEAEEDSTGLTKGGAALSLRD